MTAAEAFNLQLGNRSNCYLQSVLEFLSLAIVPFFSPITWDPGLP